MGACDGFGSANWDALRTVAPPGAVGLEPLIWSNSVAPVSVRLIGLRRVGSEPSVDRIWLVAEAEAWGNLAQGCAGDPSNGGRDGYGRMSVGGRSELTKP